MMYIKNNYKTIILLMNALFIGNATADEVVINLQGHIKEGTCQVANYQKVLSLTGDQQYIAIHNTFPTVGSASQAIPFTIELKDCDPKLNISIRFDGVTVSGHDNILMLTQGASSADGAGIQILDKEENPINIGEKTAVAFDVKKETAYVLPFYARYIRYSNDRVKEGEANGKVDFTFTYD